MELQVEEIENVLISVMKIIRLASIIAVLC
jgi:hypothetical protein